MTTILLSYKLSGGFITDSGTTYVMTFYKTGFFGLYKKTYSSLFNIPLFTNTASVLQRWDDLIKTKKPL